jgi:Ca2+-binding EF-hand superfamily protein
MNPPRVILPVQLREELRECFTALDVNNSGGIDLKETTIALRAMGFEPRRDEIRSMVDEIVRESINNAGKCFTGNNPTILCISFTVRED